jgi:hypothetical protein
MATIGKWWGRNPIIYVPSPAWAKDNAIRGTYVYDKNTGKRWAHFVGGSSQLIIQELYSTTALCSINYSNFGIGNICFIYNGFLYTVRITATTPPMSHVLVKINLVTGASTDVRTFSSSSTAAFYALVFDEVDTVYFLYTSGSPISHVYVASYNIGSDTLTVLRDETTYKGVPRGIALDGTTLYFMINGLTAGHYYSCSMTTGGASFAATDLSKTYAPIFGYKGFYCFSDSGETVIQTRGGTSFNLGVVPWTVFVDDSAGVANARFFVWSYTAGTVYFREFDGATLKNTLTYSVTLSGGIPSGIYRLRNTDSNEEGVSVFTVHQNWWLEARPSMKEVT